MEGFCGEACFKTILIVHLYKVVLHDSELSYTGQV